MKRAIFQKLDLDFQTTLLSATSEFTDSLFSNIALASMVIQTLI